ncbi:MAG: hypothetical protein LC751_12710 [Actinobacteria bacterium]|nr:hypothetical protein [Actinomycetota bacterium]
MTGSRDDRRGAGPTNEGGARAKRQKNTGTSGLCCSDLEGMELLDTSKCCETYHSAEDHTIDSVVVLGPCRATLPDGTLAFVCCAARKQLLGGVVS